MNELSNLAIPISAVSFILCIQENFTCPTEYCFSEIHCLSILNF